MRMTASIIFLGLQDLDPQPSPANTQELPTDSID